MSTTPQQVYLWRQAPSEHQRLEFKEAKHQFDTRKLHEYCVALANEGGGVLLLGVADKPPRQVVSTQAFPDTVAAAERLFLSTLRAPVGDGRADDESDASRAVPPGGGEGSGDVPGDRSNNRGQSDQARWQRGRLAQIRPLPPFLGMRPF